MKRSALSGKKIAITTTSFAEFDGAPLALLKEAGVGVVSNTLKRKLEKAEILALCGGCDGIVAGTERYDSELLRGMPGLKVISRCGVGIDNVDVRIAKELGIRVCNTPDAPTQAVAELTVGLMFDLMRRVPSMDRAIRRGVWKKEMGNLLSGKHVGIVGFGRIGRKVGGLLTALGCDVAYADPVAPDAGSSFKRMPLKELLVYADIVSVHVSGAGMVIGDGELSLMKRGSWLVNVSRGGTVDEKALAARLRDGRLAGAALDVFDEEPYKGELIALDNVILSPHIGSYAKESRVEMEMQAVRNLMEGLEGVR